MSTPNTATTPILPRYVVKTSSASMPQSCWGRYAHVAVLETRPGTTRPPLAITPRDRSVARVVAIWERVNVGTTDRCAYRRALRAAQEMAARMNAGALG